ncbi:MAG: nucleotidyltransferase domain-containing protein [Cyanobacteriota bacterium]|nr:nucleotidyltransferase domain-containing protein [Cyanobacteriota bacterium]
MEVQAELSIPLAIALPMGKIITFCQRWQISELSVFGSILGDNFRIDSDIDFLYVLKPNITWSFSKLIQAEEELAQLLGREVDLVSKVSIEQSHNWLRKKNILSSAKAIYGDQ